MDRLSVMLIGAICFLIFTSAAAIYTTWFRNEDAETLASSPEQIQEEMSLANIAMNTQAQVINGGGRDMWIRAEVQMPEESAALGKTQYQLVSDAIAENPGDAEKEKGVWELEEDGYYYYSVPVRPGEQSRSLFQSVRAVKKQGGPSARAGNSRTNVPAESVKVRAEGIQVNWVSREAKTCQQAYRLFELYQPIWDDRAEFV